MKSKILFSSTLALFLLSCDPAPMEPETGCDLRDEYIIGLKSLYAAKVFDVRTTPPTEIKNGYIEYDLTYQWTYKGNKPSPPYPYNEYFIDKIEFFGETEAHVNFSRDTIRVYDYVRDDCQLLMTSPQGNLHIELTESGAEIFERRFAIYNHKLIGTTFDSFIFIEFRDAAFKSYEDIISEFAFDNPGIYDTIAVEIVHNSTRE